ncbi:serine/threonine/tyrosine-interacting-like protein 1 [Bufo gargarizans]|uniref:serine/threonine/tyrosine-interacting-like protein 1 n=1 Tax=Bufo gargarizans TaxID=30331 RepID=UPI001CF54604|nr:serine/threonine/tyrosine-interacting-like protein 1 [Bufo gargarizans]XP_044142039.1 serine/threonine/tyrosine-interacting-like protein 1 [Bufo gargarizans]
MADLVSCTATELYNILNQSTKSSKLAEPNYLCLLDARTKREYNESHIITARRAKQNEDSCFLLPESIELDCMKYCVVYDSRTDSLDGEGPAIQCAQVMSKVTRLPVMVLKGGYEEFSAYYHFFRSQKVFWMPQEIDELQPYPIEIIPGLLYMGDVRQANDRHIQKDLKIKSHVNVSLKPTNLFLPSGQVLQIPEPDLCDSDLLQFFPSACQFIDAHMATNCAVLVFSTLGISRSSAVLIAYIIHSRRCPLQEAWNHVLKCKTNMRPNRGFVQQLSEWEKTVLGHRLTDISDPKF